MTTATIIPSLTNNPPSRSNPDSFITDGDSFLNDLPGVVSGVNIVATELNTWNAEVETFKNQASSSQANADSSSTTSLTQARNAAASIVSLWVSGTTYPAGQIVYSNVDGREYKRITAGAGSADPSSDTANWEPLGWEYITNYPDIRPTLDLNFAGSQTVDPRITFTRNSIATYFDKFGVMQTAAVNQPRIDFDPGTGECKGLLVEESRTNLSTFSEQFNDASWVKSNLSVVADQVPSPTTANNADKIVENNTTNYHYVSKNISVTSGTTYTFSVFAKKAENSFINIQFGGALGSSLGVSTDLDTGQQIGYNSAVTFSSNNAGNGWWRVSITTTAAATATGAVLILTSKTLSSNPTYLGNGTSGCYIWGAQFEQGSFTTSYIPTSGTSVTRQADVAIMQGTSFSSWYKSDEGSFLAIAQSLPGNSSRRVFSVSDGTSSNNMQLIQSDSSGATSSIFEIRVSGTTHSSLNPAIAHDQTVRSCSVRFGLNNFALSRNGLPVITDTSGTVPIVNRLYIGNDLSTNQLNGWISRLCYFPKPFVGRVLRQMSSL